MFSSYSYQAARRWIAVFAFLACVSIGFLGFATATTTTVVVEAGSSAPSVYGEQVTFEVTLTGVQTPSGKVELYDGATLLDSKDPITSTTVTFDVSTLSVGSHTINAEYGGSVTYSYDASSDSIFHTVTKDDTTTAVSSSKNTSGNYPVTGEDVTFTATVTADTSSEIPTGGVTFYADGNVIGSGLPLNGSGQTTCIAAFNAADSTVAITASYGGDGNYNTSSGTLSPAQTIEEAETTTTVVSDKTSPVTGESVTFTATVDADSPGSGTPTGTVTFTFSPAAVSPQTVTLNNGQAEYTTSMLKASVDPYSVTATYNPPVTDPNYITSSDSLDTPQAVDKAVTVIVITGDDPDPSVEGEAYTVTWSISVSAPGSETPGSPTGNVTVGDGDGNTCVEAWETDDNCSITSALAGSKTLTATYDGDGDYETSDTTASHTVNTADTSVDLTSTPNPSDIGQNVVFTATVTADAPGAGTPTGTVEFFYDDGTTSPTPNWVSMTGSTANPATLSGGTATFTDATLAAGDWDIKAEYVAAGGSLFNDSTSSIYTQTVNKLDLTLTINTDNDDPSEVGESYTVTWSTSPSTTGGAVTVSDGTSSCTGSCTGSGVAVETGTCTLTSTTVGLKTLTATYAGNATYNPATDTEPHQVNQGTVSIDIDPVDNCSSLTPIVTWTSGDSGCFTATVAAAGDASGTPTGTVTFHIEDVYGGTIDNSGPHLLSSGSACSDSVTLTASQSQVKVVVSYSGDTNFAATSNTYYQTVTAPTPGVFTISKPTSGGASPLAGGFDLEVTYAAGGFPADGTVYFCVSGPDPTIPVLTSSVLAGQTTTPSGTLTVFPAIAGVYAIDARYDKDSDASGDCSTALGTGDELADTVFYTLYACTTTTEVTCSPDPVYVNQPTTLTAVVTPGTGCTAAGLVGKTVGFASKDLPTGAAGDFSSDYCILVGGVADAYCSSVTYTPTSSGADCGSSPDQTHKIVATFSDGDYLTSSNETTFTVRKRPPAVSVVCTPDSVYIDQETTCTVTVDDGTVAPGSTIPEGTVSFDDDSKAGAFAPSDIGSLTHGTYDVAYTPAAGDAGTSSDTTEVIATYGGSEIYCGDDSLHADLEVMLRPTETTLTWEDSNGGNETLYLRETGRVIVTVTDIGPADSVSPPQGTLTHTGPITLVSSLTPVSASASQAIYSFTAPTYTDAFVAVTATYAPVTPQTHDASDGSVDVPVQKRDTEMALVCLDVSPYTCTATVTDTAPRGTPSAPGGRIVDQGDNTEYCSSTTVTGPATSTCAKDYPGTAMYEPVAAGYEPDDDIHNASYAMCMIERDLVPDGACGTLHIEDTIFGLNTTCTVMAALQVLLESGAAAASILVDPVWTAIFPGSTVPIGDMIAGGLTGLSLHGEIAIQTMCADVDGDGIPGSVEAVIAGLEDHKWDSDGDKMGDLDEIDEAGGNFATSYDASTDYSSCACPNPTVADSDGDGLLDGQENGFYPTSFCDPDSDDDSLTDKQEVDTWDPAVYPDVRDRADPLLADTDGDGLRDDKEFYSNSCPFINDDDSDDDGLQDGTEDWNHSGTIETGTIGDTGTRGPASVAGVSGETHFCNPDTDGDGLTDGEEFALFGGLRPDPDVGQGFIDVSVVGHPNWSLLATIPALDMDSDDDGLSDYEEVHVTQTNPLDWDTDDDTISDLNELIATGGAWPQRAFKQVSDPLDPDTDDDDLLDNIEYSGTALGTSHGIGGTDDLVCPFVNDDDSDDDGLQDGTEGWSGDGSITTGTIGDSTTQAKTSPTTGETDFCNPDTDGDGLTDGEEVALLGGLPVSSTTGFTTVIPQGVSTTFGQDGLPLPATVPALDDDSDNDGLSDYEEVNITHTDPLDADSDNDTLSDANELLCIDGTWPKRTFQQESDPLDPDTDDDDLYDQIEYSGTAMPLRATGGTPDIICPYVNDDDSDDDGLQDGTEDASHDGTWGVGGSGITVGSFATQASKTVTYWECDLCNPDSDGDGLLDGEEVGLIGGGPTGAGTTRPTTGFDAVAPAAVSAILPLGTGPAGSPPGTGNSQLGPYIFSPVPNGTISGTVPALDVDSDNDGLSDYEEVNITGTDPLDQDTDNDTLKDADELIATGGTVDITGNPGTGPRRTFDQESDPLDINTDDDHLFDPQEYQGSGLSLLAGILGGVRDLVCPFVNDDDSDNDGIQDGAVVTIDPALVVTGTLLTPDTYDYSYTHYEDFIDVDGSTLAFPGEAEADIGTFDGEQRDESIQNVCDPDSDGDGLNDGEEIAIGTNPDDCDTDDDGRNDWHEVTGGGPIPTDPFDPDTDDDGLLDSAEVFGTNPTNPLNADTDGDGLCDGGTGTPWMTNNPLDPRVVVNPICKSCAVPGLTACSTSIRTGSVDGIGDHPNPHGYGEDKDGDGTWDGTIGQLWVSGAAGTQETDPNQYDTDGDAEGDGIEVLGFSTSRQSWIPTTDLFGRAITVEYPDCGCLEPLIADTDGDGLSDGYEDNNHDGNFDFFPSDFEYEQVPLPGPPQPNPNETNPCDADTDDDALNDYDERYQSQDFVLYPDQSFPFNPTNPLDHDTDNDWIYDGAEVAWVCTALTCSQLDNDTDALINEDPIDGIDNDEDGLIDEDPVDFLIRFVPMLDPTNRDSDSDGYLDGLDDDPCNSECIPTVLPPTIIPVDTDGDGFSDDSELAAGTHPNDPEDHPAAYGMMNLDLDDCFDDRLWLEPALCCGIANSVVIDIDSNVLIDFRLQVVQHRDVTIGDFDGDGHEDDARYVIEYAFAMYRVTQPRIVATIDDFDMDFVIDWVAIEQK